MTIGERLLNLSAEYAASKDAASDPWGGHMGNLSASRREPSAIAAEYESALRELLS